MHHTIFCLLKFLLQLHNIMLQKRVRRVQPLSLSSAQQILKISLQCSSIIYFRARKFLSSVKLTLSAPETFPAAPKARCSARLLIMPFQLQFTAGMQIRNFKLALVGDMNFILLRAICIWRGVVHFSATVLWQQPELARSKKINSSPCAPQLLRSWINAIASHLICIRIKDLMYTAV